MEKRIYEKYGKVVLDDSDLVVWACGRVDWGHYKPHPDLKCVLYDGGCWYTTEKFIFPCDYDNKRRGKPVVHSASWIYPAWAEGVLP